MCSLGARYGWIPDQNKTELNKQARLEELLNTKPDATMKDVWVEWRSETNSRFPFIDRMPGLSVTEYEVKPIFLWVITIEKLNQSFSKLYIHIKIQHACLIDKPACSRAFFYLRDEHYAVQHAQSEEERKLFQAESEEAVKLDRNYYVYYISSNYVTFIKLFNFWQLF